MLMEPDYPNSPGHKVPGTSHAAAEAYRDKDKPLRERVLLVLAKGAKTADETAALMGETVLAVRPRFSQLLKLHKIRDSGKTRPNLSGLQATVWELDPGPQLTQVELL